MDERIVFVLMFFVIISSLSCSYAISSDFSLSVDDNDSLHSFFVNSTRSRYNNNSNLSLFSFRENDTGEDDEVASGKLFNKSRPIYFAMDHVNRNDEEICDTIVNRLESEGFNVVSAEIGPNKMSRNTLYLYEHNVSNAIIFHLFNGVDPSTIRELATDGNDNRGRIVRSRGNDVVLAWFYDSADCVNENGSGVNLVYGSETGPSLSYPREYMIDNDIVGICTSSDGGRRNESADYTGEATVEAFMELFYE